MSSLKLSVLAPVAALSALAAAPAAAAPIAIYTFGTPEANTLASSDAFAGVMATDLTVPAGAGFRTLTNDNPTHGNPVAPWHGFVTSSASQTTESDAHDGERYYEFTVTPEPGVVMELASLSYKGVILAGERTLDWGWSVRSSIDNFAAPIDGMLLESSTSNVYEGAFEQTISLGGYSTSDPVTFRIVLFETSTSTQRYIGVDDIVLEGSAVPEPAGLAVGAVTALGMLMRRRRN